MTSYDISLTYICDCPAFERRTIIYQLKVRMPPKLTVRSPVESPVQASDWKRVKAHSKPAGLTVSSLMLRERSTGN